MQPFCIELLRKKLYYSAEANPSACYVMAMSMNNDGELAATAIVLSTLLSVVTTTLALYILKTLALI